MLELKIVAGDMLELKKRLVAAASYISDDEQGDDVQQMYSKSFEDANPQVSRIIHKEAEAMRQSPIPFPIQNAAPQSVNIGASLPVVHRPAMAPQPPINTGTPPPVAAPINHQDGGLGLDSQGFPWDSRIHSAAKTKTTDGQWRTKRGVDPKAVIAVQAESMRQASQNQMPQTIPSVPGISSGVPSFNGYPPQTTAVAPVVQAQPVQQAVAPVNYENMPLPADTKPAHSLATFKANFVPLLMDLASKGKLTQDYLASLCAHYKVGAIFELVPTDAQAQELFGLFEQAGLITRME